MQTRDYSKKAILLLPDEMRKPLMNAYAQVLNTELQIVYQRLLRIYDDIIYKLSNNSQICYLQAVCNDAIDFDQRRIRIYSTRLSTVDVVKLFDRIFENPIVLGQVTLNDRAFYNVGAYDFQVVVPQLDELNDDQLNLLNANLLFYKLAGKRYIITKEFIENE